MILEPEEEQQESNSPNYKKSKKRKHSMSKYDSKTSVAFPENQYLALCEVVESLYDVGVYI